MSETIEVTRTHLELKTPGQLIPAKADDHLLRLARVPVPSAPLVQMLYREVGADYHWVDRWAWSTDEWQRWVGDFGYGVWILTWDGELAGFVEMKNQDDGSVEITLFGLVKKYHGRGLGKHLLTASVEIAWGIGANRVWLHTCTLDDPKALPNYKARGFTEFKKETYTTVLDD